MPTCQINQDDINTAVWNACDTFREVVSARYAGSIDNHGSHLTLICKS